MHVPFSRPSVFNNSYNASVFARISDSGWLAVDRVGVVRSSPGEPQATFDPRAEQPSQARRSVQTTAHAGLVALRRPHPISPLLRVVADPQAALS